MEPMTLPLAPPTTHEFSAQLRRIDILHQKLKYEAARTQEYLAKLKRGEDIQTQVPTTQYRSPAAEDSEPQGATQRRDTEIVEKTGNSSENHTRSVTTSDKDSICCCQHHQQSKIISEKERKLAEDYHKKASPLASSFPPLPTHVDEREVRDLEKRVRGLEGRVRGFEGLPPDREIALLEVERLRRELEGLARRREGLFGLMDEKSKAEVMKNKADVNKVKVDAMKTHARVNEKIIGKTSGRLEARKG